MGELTTSLASADSTVAGVLDITADVANTSIVEAVAIKVLAKDVLNTPEAARGNGGAVGASRNRSRDGIAGALSRRNAKLRAHGKGARDTGDECRHHGE